MANSIGEWAVEESRNAMDDTLFRVAAIEERNPQKQKAGTLVFSAKIFPGSVLPFLYMAFPKKIFSKREEFVRFRFRFDQEPPSELTFNPSEEGADAHVENSGKIYVPMISASQLLVELPTMSTGLRTLKFHVEGFAHILNAFVGEAIGFPVQELSMYHPSITDYLLRCGPKKMACIVEALNGVRPRKKLPSYAGRKSHDIFEAVQDFATVQRASEIYGRFEEGKSNDSWSSRLYNSANPELKRRWDPLKIND